ncbi:MAG: tetratricopeptide repeat protein, partial [Candidatus Eisenbacteria bacterium]
MRAIRFVLAPALILLAFSSATAAIGPGPLAALDRGKAAEQAFDYEAAHAAYLAGVMKDSTSYELWWRLAHVAGDRGTRAEFDHERPRAEAAFAEAVRAARKATAIDSDAWEGHFELASALGRYALFQSVKSKIELSKEVKLEADRALAINPQSDRAYHVLARWNRAIAQLSFFERAAAKVVYGGVPEGASMNNAVTLFEKAIALAPDYANHRLELARTYLDLGLKDKAREQLKRALACP